MFCLLISTLVYKFPGSIGLPILLQPNRQTDPGNIEIVHRYMNVIIVITVM